jgi:hypothetical protein
MSRSVWVQVFDNGGGMIGDPARVEVPQGGDVDNLKKISIEELNLDVQRHKLSVRSRFSGDNETPFTLVNSLVSDDSDTALALVLPQNEGQFCVGLG